MDVVLFASILIALSGRAEAPARALSPREVIEAKFAAVNRHSVADVVRFYAPNASITSSGFCSPRQGQADVQRTYQALIEGLPDLVAEVNLYIVEGARVAVIFTVKGHMQGTSVAVRIANFFTVRDGLIETDDGIYDTGGRPCTP